MNITLDETACYMFIPRADEIKLNSREKQK
jgi:hypothetical protein